MDKILNVKETAEFLNCHPQSVYRSKDLPFFLIPGIGKRFKSQDLEKYLDQRINKPIEDITQLIKNKKDSLHLPLDFDIILLNKSGGNCEMPKGKTKTRFNFGYGAIYQRKTSKGKIRWYADYKNVEGKRVQSVIPNAVSKEEAHFALRQAVQNEFDRKNGIKREKQDINFKDFSDLYMKNYSMVKKRAWEKSDKVYLNASLNPFFGGYMLSEIDTELIEKFIAKRQGDGVEKTSINRDLSCLKKMFNKAIDWEYQETNPALKIKQFPEKDNFRNRILTHDEEERLLNESVNHVRGMILISLNTGMRRGEILNLKWDQIDLEYKLLRVENTKSGMNRYIPINSELHTLLERYKLEKGLLPQVFVNPATKKPFTTIKTAFNAACKRAGIKNFRFHDLRRTFATRLLQNGIDIETVRCLLGHHSVLVTQRYTHSNVDSKRKAVELLNQKPADNARNREDLLHIRDMNGNKKHSFSPSAFFSVN